jgi:hypothetical protein
MRTATAASGASATRIPSARAAPPPPPVQPLVVSAALGALGAGAVGLAAGYGIRHGVLLLVGGSLGLVLHQAAFGFASAFRAFARDGTAGVSGRSC